MYYIFMSILVSILIISPFPTADAEDHTQKTSSDITPAQHRKGRIHRGKEEAEGTQAPNRFEADIIIKSKYEHNGQPLEVDTD